MSLQGIQCDVCKDSMAKRLTDPMAVQILMVDKVNQMKRVFTVPLAAYCTEYQVKTVPVMDAGGQIIPDQMRDVDSLVREPQDMDICQKCTISLVQQALEKVAPKNSENR